MSLWVDLFRDHNLLSFASGIAFRALVAFVALVLLVAGVLGELGRRDVWDDHIGPAIEPKVLPEVYAGIDATFQKIFATSSIGLIVFAGLLTILTTYLYVGAIVLLVGIELDEQLRKDVEGKEDRGILELVRGIL